jgi:ribosomal protein L11 methyltransferase
MAFVQLRISGSAHPEFVDEALSVVGARSVSYVDAGDDPVLEPRPGETPLWRNTVVVGLFDESVDSRWVERTLRELVPDGASLTVAEELVEDQDWIRAWLVHWQPLRFGRRLWVTPAEKRTEVPPHPENVVMTLDPGLAFGTGTHPTTALCLEWLEGEPLQGRTVIDFGCGSGILAIAALLLGAKRAYCTDIDPQALLATQQNAATNGVADRLECALPDAFAAPRCDYVLANILAGPLVELAPRLVDRLAPNGRIVLAGLLDRQAEEVRAAYAPRITLDNDTHLEGWTRVAGTLGG